MASISRARRKWTYRALLERDGPWCTYCTVLLEDGIPKRRMTIDHVVPTVRGGSNRLSNLALACYSCNQNKGDATASEYLESAICIERRNTVIGHVRIHKHEAVLFNRSGNWSCLCGACGTKDDKPVATPCTLWDYAAFYRPDKLVEPPPSSDVDWDRLLQGGAYLGSGEDPFITAPVASGSSYAEEAEWYQGDWAAS